MSQLDLVPTSPQNMAVKKNYWMPWKAAGKMNTSDSTTKLVTLELPPEKVASTELTRFQRLKQKVSAIRASVVAQAEAHPKIAAGLVGCVVAAAVWGVRFHVTDLGGLIRGETPVKSDLNGSAHVTDGTNATAVVPNPSNTKNVVKQKTGNEPAVTSLMQKLMPTKVNWKVAGKVGVVVAAVLVAKNAKKVIHNAILEWWGIGPKATASVHRDLEKGRLTCSTTNKIVPH